VLFAIVLRQWSIYLSDVCLLNWFGKWCILRSIFLHRQILKTYLGNGSMVLIKKTKERIRVGVCALIWAIWNCRNDVIFNNAGRDQFLQVMHTTTYWIHMWSLILPEDQREFMYIGCTRLMAFIRAIFNQDGWQHTNRIHDA
jgi:hypothetical protein